MKKTGYEDANGKDIHVFDLVETYDFSSNRLLVIEIDEKYYLYGIRQLKRYESDSDYSLDKLTESTAKDVKVIENVSEFI